MNGYIRLWRTLAHHELWLRETFTEGQAWADLLMLSNYKNGWIHVRGIRLPIARGQVGWAEVSLAKRWKWSRGKCRRFLQFLEQQNMLKIEQQKNRITTVLTILNYDKWQKNDTTDDTTDKTTDGTTNGQQTDTNNKNKKDKKNTFPPTPQGRETWLTPYFKKWQEILGGEMPAPQAARYLRPLELANGREKTILHLENYLKSVDVRYGVNLAKFSETFGQWNEVRPPNTWARPQADHNAGGTGKVVL